MDSVPVKFDTKDIVPLDSGVPAKFDVSQIQPDAPLASGPDFSNPQKEGLYAMRGPSGTAQVPYSKVATAIQNGYHMEPDVLKRYASDLRAAKSKSSNGMTWRDPLTRIDPHQPVHSASDLGREVVRGVGNVGGGLLTPVLRPVATLEGAGHFIAHPVESAAAMSGQFFNPDDTIAPHALENLEGLVGQAAVLGTAGEVAGPITRGLMDKVAKTREGIRTGVQSLTGAGGRVVKGKVIEAGEAAKTADEAHLEKTQEALHETEGKELKHQQDLKAAKETAEREGKEQTAKQIAARNQAIQDRRVAEEKLTSEKLKQGKISPTQAKLENSWSTLRAAVETAREKALATGNSKYSGVNEALSHLDADPEMLPNALSEASESLRGSKADPTLLKDMEKVIERGDVPTYADLQGDYSRLGSEIAKGTLPGDVFHAYDVLHEAIGDEMQRIADSKGQGAALTSARNYWRLMKQTFGKPFNATDAATKTLNAAAPDVASAAELDNRVRLLGSFDPEIPKLFNHIENIHKGVESLPKPTPERTLTEKAKLPSVPARGKPITVEPKSVAPPERAPLPDRPESSAIDTRAVREKLVDKWATGESSLNKWQVRALLSGGLSAVIDGLGLLGGHTPGLGSMVLEAGGTAAYTFGPAMVAKMLENPGFREWITRPPAGELDTLQKLPNADRIKITDGLKPVIQQAQQQGINVSPALTALVGAAGTAGVPRGPKTQQLQKTADDARNAAPAQ